MPPDLGDAQVRLLKQAFYGGAALVHARASDIAAPLTDRDRAWLGALEDELDAFAADVAAGRA